jgi:hypothetical protein
MGSANRLPKENCEETTGKYKVAQERLAESGTDSTATVAHTAKVLWSEVALLVGLA